MKKLIILLFLIPFIGFSQTFTWIKTDDISATRTDFIEFNDTIILKSGDKLWKLTYTTDTIFINDDTVLIVGGGTAYGFYHSGNYTMLVNSTDNVGIGVDTARYALDVSGTANALEYKAKKNEWQALVSFTWDDGTEWEHSIMLPLFNAKGEVATANIVTDWIGGANRMTWDEVRALQAAGWEIGSHSLDHKYLSTLSEDSVILEFKNSLAKLESENLNVTSFAYPYNDAGGYALDHVSDYYRCARTSHGDANNTDTLNDNVLRSYSLTSVESDDHTQIATYKRLVDRAQDENAWLIFYAHQPDSDDSTMVAELIDYIQAKGDTIDIVTISQGMDLIGNQIDLSDDFAVNNENIRLNGSIYRNMIPFLHTYEDATADGDNLFIGVQSGNTTMSPGGGASSLASGNASFGGLTLNSTTTGYNNTAVGFQNSQYMTTGFRNSSIGLGSLRNNTIGDNNVGLGYQSMYSNNSGADNIGIGSKALYWNTGVNSSNVAIGTNAMFGVSGSTLTYRNIAIGHESLKGITTGITNVAVGYQSGLVNTIGGENVFIGSSAGVANTTGISNTLVGESAGASISTQGYNVMMGWEVGLLNTGTTNVFVGGRTARLNTGSNNTILGYKAGYNGDGNYNVFIGYEAGYSETGNQKLYIDMSNTSTPLIHGHFDLDYLLINNRLGITDGGAEFSPAHALVVTGSADVTNIFYCDTIDDSGAGFVAIIDDIEVNGTYNYAADAQADDDYEIAIPTITALVEGLTVTFKANTANTGAATLEITSVGDLDAILKMHDQPLATGDIEAGQMIVVVFDGTNWQMTSQLAQ